MYQTPFTLLELSSIPLPMNTLTLARRAAVVRCLIDGASIRATARMTQTDKDTVSKILIEVGSFASEYQNLVLTNLSCRRIEADEIWAFVGAKAGNAITAEPKSEAKVPKREIPPEVPFSTRFMPAQTRRISRLNQPYPNMPPGSSN